MTMMDDGMQELMRARRMLDKAHLAACAAMARFDAVKNADIMMADERIAARSLLDQTVPLCKAILVAMQTVPEAAGIMGQVAVVRDQQLEVKSQPPVDRDRYPRLRAGLVAFSARHGRPICSAIH